MLKTMRLQLVIHLIMYGTNLTLTELDSVSVFQLAGWAKHKKKWCDFEAINVSCMVCINATRFSALQTKTNSFNKKGKQQPLDIIKWVLLKIATKKT